MNIVDIVLIVILVIAGLMGYFRGFLKELYGLIILVLSILLALIFQGMSHGSLTSSFNFSETFNLSLPPGVLDIILNIVGPMFGFITVLGIGLTIFPIIKFILIKTKVIPKKLDKYRYLGVAIAAFKTIFIYTVIAFLFSFTDFIPNVTIYDDSLFLKPLLSVDPPLEKISNNIHNLYTDVTTLNEKMNNFKENPNPQNVSEVVDTLKDIKESGLLTDDMIVDTSGILLDELSKDESVDINLSDTDFESFKISLNQSEYYPIMKGLFDEGVITESLIEKIVEANNITGVNASSISDLFK